MLAAGKERKKRDSNHFLIGPHNMQDVFDLK